MMQGTLLDMMCAWILTLVALIGLLAVWRRTLKWVRISFYLSVFGLVPYFALLIPPLQLDCTCSDWVERRRLEMFAWLSDKNEPYTLFNPFPWPDQKDEV